MDVGHTTEDTGHGYRTHVRRRGTQDIGHRTQDIGHIVLDGRQDNQGPRWLEELHGSTGEVSML